MSRFAPALLWSIMLGLSNDIAVTINRFLPKNQGETP